jgi:hypothetical protein
MDHESHDTSDWEFDVSTATHDDLKKGVLERVWSRVVMSREEFPTFGDAASTAANLAACVHGGMPTNVLVRI